ncbi:MAG: PA2779 family protein [Elusimicrobia bacterium]|nr:PA2779 family protein [Elusimicrobiota bacterium]
MKIRSGQAAVRSLVWTLILAVTALFAAPPSGWASLAPADLQSGAAAPGAARAEDMRTVSKALESKALRGRLASMGLDEKEIDSRLKNLSDQEVHQLAVKLEAVRPGGLIEAVLVIVVLVLLILYLVKRV